MMTYLQVTSRADVTLVIDRLPVFPRAAREVVRQVANPDVGPREMEAVASGDPGTRRPAHPNGELGLLQPAAAHRNHFPRGLLYRYRDRAPGAAGRRHPRQLLDPSSASHLEPQSWMWRRPPSWWRCTRRSK